MKPIKYILLLPTLLLIQCLTAQNDLLRVRNFGIEDGLSQRDVYRVTQDDHGFLWVATKSGLDRFDGHHFTNWYQGLEKNYMPAGIQHDLIANKDDQVWLSRGDVMVKTNHTKEAVDTIAHFHSQEGVSWINHLCEDGLGRIWTTKFTPRDSSFWLQILDKSGAFNNVVQLPGDYLNRPIARVHGHVFLGAYENEIWVFDLDGKQIEQFEFPAPVNTPSYSRVIQLQTDQKGTVWAMLDHGQMYYLPANANAFVRHPISNSGFEHFHPSAFMVEDNGDVWMGGLVATGHADDEDSPCSGIQPGTSLLHFNSIANKIEDYSYFLKQALPYAEAPRQIFQDNGGVIWIATPFGLIRLVKNNLFERYMADGNDCCRDGICSMRGITEDELGNIYCSYYSSIHILNPSNGSLVPLFSEQVDYPYSILYDKGYIYTGEGLRIHIRSERIDTLVSGMAEAEGVLMRDHDQEIWFGNKDQLVRYNPGTGQVTPFEEPNDRLKQAGLENITYLHKSKDKNHFWLATREAGVFKIHKYNGVVAHYHLESDPALPHNRILALVETNGHVWMATAAGLCQLNLNADHTEVFTVEHGLPNSFINGLLPEGDSAVWVSTDNGLSRMDIFRRSFSNFFHADGLSNNEFNRISFHQSTDGRMYFGGINGINAFYPNARYGERKTKMNAQLLFTQFSKYDGHRDQQTRTGIENGQEMTLSHQDETFTFYFSLADFTNPRNHLYSFKLEGYNTEWSEPTPINFARFVNIPPGNYVFRAKGARSKGDWVKNELTIPITIKQAFYKTGWFRVIAFGLLTVLVYGIMQYRLYIAKKKEEELENLVQQRTKELETEKAKSDELLLNILPSETAEELKQYGSAKARRHDDVTVFFSDFKGFSFISKNLEPEALVAEIDYCFRAFDKIIEEFDLEKIKTVGDAYLCGGGFNEGDKKDAAVRVIKAALKIQTFLGDLSKERQKQGRPCFEARVGIHSGPVVSGIVGIKKFAYDIWGDTVNVSERLQSNGAIGKVNISKSTFELVKDHFECTYRGKVAAKHQGEIDMYFVEACKQ